MRDWTEWSQNAMFQCIRKIEEKIGFRLKKLKLPGKGQTSESLYQVWDLRCPILQHIVISNEIQSNVSVY